MRGNCCLQVRQKLEGVEAGESGPRSVAGQVAQLLVDAQVLKHKCGTWLRRSDSIY